MNKSLIYKSIFAGILISFSCILFASVDNKIVGSLLFAMGLLSIISLKLNLYTGKVGFLNVKNINDYFKIIWIFIGNLLGNAITYLMISVSFSDDSNTINNLQNIAMSKISKPWYILFILGIGCGILMYVAVSTNNTLLTIMCVSGFILCGFEHSIADAFYLCYAPDYISNAFKLIMIALGNGIGAIFANSVTKMGE